MTKVVTSGHDIWRSTINEVAVFKGERTTNTLKSYGHNDTKAQSKFSNAIMSKAIDFWRKVTPYLSHIPKKAKIIMK